MTNRIIQQFQGFIDTPAIFLKHEIYGLSLFHKSLEMPSECSNTADTKNFSKNTVLGKRVEQFFKIAIEADANFNMIAHNIQIQSEKRTLGELDFVLEDLSENQILHVELMYKFYVYDPEIRVEMERWIGPNRKDTLLRKIEKVKTNQFPLLHTPEAEKYLRSINLKKEDIQQEICFKASLFIPESLMGVNLSHINKKCIAGCWLHLKDFSKYDQTGFQFFAPEKQDWPIDPKYGEDWCSFKEIVEQIKNLHLRKKSPLIWINKPVGSFEKLIVVWW